MEVVVITHKGGQRSDGSVSTHTSDCPKSHAAEKHNTNVMRSSLTKKKQLTCLVSYIYLSLTPAVMQYYRGSFSLYEQVNTAVY